jgi:hypothetical protein
MLARLGLRIGDRPAERSTSHLLGRMLDELPTHDPERAPLTHWLDAVVDRYGEEERHADASTSESPLPRLSRRSHSQPFAHPH